MNEAIGIEGRPNLGLTLTIVWFDDDLVELRVRADNGRFSGTTDAYADRDGLAELVGAFQGFPRSIEDRRESMLGTFDAGYAGGGARLILHCTDAAGHAVMEVQLRTGPRDQRGKAETVELVIPVEAAAIDEFVAALRRMPVEIGASASLRQSS